MRLKRSQEFNTGREDIWLSMECEEGGTFGTLITEVDIHPRHLEGFSGSAVWSIGEIGRTTGR